MQRNTELLEKVMQHIEDHPEQHDQALWVNECGTAGCFAGWACLLSGWQVAPRFSFSLTPMMSPDTLTERSAPEAAIDLLGIDLDDADTLFSPCNTRSMLRLMVKDLVNGDELRTSDQYREEAQS